VGLAPRYHLSKSVHVKADLVLRLGLLEPFLTEGVSGIPRGAPPREQEKR